MAKPRSARDVSPDERLVTGKRPKFTGWDPTLTEANPDRTPPGAAIDPLLDYAEREGRLLARIAIQERTLAERTARIAELELLLAAERAKQLDLDPEWERDKQELVRLRARLELMEIRIADLVEELARTALHEARTNPPQASPPPAWTDEPRSWSDPPLLPGVSAPPSAPPTNVRPTLPSGCIPLDEPDDQLGATPPIEQIDRPSGAGETEPD